MESLENWEAIQDRLDSQRSWKRQLEDCHDDFEYAEILASRPDAEIIVFSGYIEVVAYTKGVGDRLPRIPGRRYVGSAGDVRWRFPLSALEKLRKLGFPVLTV